MSEPYRLLAAGKYVAFDEMCWPTPMDATVASDETDLEWRLRYGVSDARLDEKQLESDRLSAASIVSAYRELLTCPREKRERVIRVMRKAMEEAGG